MAVSERYKLFCEHYDRWLADCLVEFNQRYGESRKYTEFPEVYPDDYDPGQLVEFAENGDAYPHGYGGTNWIPKAVTPWEQSEHYVK